MHLPFIAHTRTCQMYVTITCTRLKYALCFVSYFIIYYYYQFFQRRVTQKAKLPVQGDPLVHKYNTHSTIQNKIMNKHYTITNKQTQYNDNKQTLYNNK